MLQKIGSFRANPFISSLNKKPTAAMAKSVNELSEASQNLLKELMESAKCDLHEVNFPRETCSVKYISKRFPDGSFVETNCKKETSGQSLLIKFLRMNRRPLIFDINTKGVISCPEQTVNISSIIEKYFPNILEKLQYGI